MMKWVEFPVPFHFNRTKVGEIWRVPYQERAQDAFRWAATHDIPPAALDKPRVLLMLIDVQNTFCIPGFELFVGGRSGTGAVDDNIRLSEFIYRNLRNITEITVTLDTHKAMQIFHPLFLVDEKGNNPAPMTSVSLEDVRRGVWKVNPALTHSLGDYDSLQRHLLHYVTRLQEGGKYQLMIWPYHAMFGGIGHCLVSAVEEALFFHAMARSYQTLFEVKGDNPLTENYSVLRPEVLDGPGGLQVAGKNIRLIQRLLNFDMVIIAGQAKSHCVAWTIDDLLNEAWTIDDLLKEAGSPGGSFARKVYLLEDCTSPVVVPGIVDFTAEGDAAFRRFESAGMHLVSSTAPMRDWPGVS